MGRLLPWLWVLCGVPTTGWSQGELVYESYSADGQRALRKRVVGKDCLLEVVNGTAVEWTLPRCPGLAEDLLFLSNSGTRFWVLRVYPMLPAVKKKRYQWGEVVVARLYDPTGKVVGTRRLTELVGATHQSELRKSEHRFKWLEGVLEVPGKKPRVNDENQVEFETVGTRTVRLSF